MTEDVQVLRGCIINTHAVVDEGTLVNSVSILERDCFIEKLFNHLTPSAVLSGSVRTVDYVHISNGVQ